MSFASDAQLEMAHSECESAACARSELCAALLASGGISLQGFGRFRVRLVSSDATIVRRCFTLLKKYFDVTGELRVLKTEQFGGMTRYQLVLPDESARELLDRLLLLDAESLFGLRQSPPEDLFADDACRVAFLRAAFLFCGTMTNPERAYHIEFDTPSEQFAQTVMELLNKFEIRAKNTCRKGKEVVYLKGSEGVSDVLTLLGAHKSVLELENIRIAKELRNQVNRQINCDSSNINRSVMTAERQMADIQYIEEELGLDKLPRTLQEIARVRMDYPETSLSGIGELLTPPLGKSGVNARLRRISEIAAKLRSGEEIDI